ncbi:MAG: amino acid permease [Gammaproteobacteria bacterium]|nr:amino acid permease [Gammaproteobacteria bacterium]
MDKKALFRKKVSTHEDFADSGLRKCLSAFDLTLLGIGCIIGTGIFVLTGIAAATQAGPAVILSYVAAGIACGCAALAYAELAASVGGCGSAYGYSYAAFGELFAWIIGWDLILEYGFATAAVANGWAGYFSDFLTSLGWGLPESLRHAPKHGGIVNLPAAGIVLLLMALLVAGVKQSASANAVVVYVKLATVGLFIIFAIGHVDAANWSPFMPYGWYEELADGRKVGVFAAASLVFFAYIGFDAVSTAAEEAANPRRDLPIGILASLGICTVLYIVVSAIMTGIVPYTTLNVSSPASHALLQVGATTAATIISFGVIIGLISVMLVLYYGLTRVIFAMSRDGLISDFFAFVSPRTQTPARVIIICGLIMATIAGVIPLGELAELVNIGTLAAFVLVCIGVIVMRVLHPGMPRPFRTPFSPAIPVLGAVSCFYLIYTLPVVTWLRFLVWLVIGMVIYFGYSIHQSKLNSDRLLSTE